LRKVGRTDGRTDIQVILYSVQCYALHWTDNKTNLCFHQSCRSVNFFQRMR